MNEEKFIIAGEEVGQRLDLALTRLCQELTRSQAQRLIESGQITVDGKTEKNNYRLKEGQEVQISFPQPAPAAATPEDIPLDVVYEDSDIVVINKPQGLVVHPAVGNSSGTLVNALLYHIEGLSGIGGQERPGIVHRLDKDTSGLLVVAKNDHSHLGLTRQLAERTMGREYLALAHGRFREEVGSIDLPIGRHLVERKKMTVRADGRQAKTHYMVIEHFFAYTLVLCKLDTGRTHQIRVHLCHVGHPIVGDPVYGPRENALGLSGQLLHAQKLTLLHPRTNERMEFVCELPALFQNTLARLRIKSHKR